MKYDNLFIRLVANTAEPERDEACWRWTGKKDQWSYGQVNVYVPGLGRAVTLKAHIVAWVWFEAECTCADDAYLAYQELQAAGLELDHLCVEASCIRPDCFEAVTPSENCRRRNARRSIMC